jgi:hypothetical protein
VNVQRRVLLDTAEEAIVLCYPAACGREPRADIILPSIDA